MLRRGSVADGVADVVAVDVVPESLPPRRGGRVDDALERRRASSGPGDGGSDEGSDVPTHEESHEEADREAHEETDQASDEEAGGPADAVSDHTFPVERRRARPAGRMGGRGVGVVVAGRRAGAAAVVEVPGEVGECPASSHGGPRRFDARGRSRRRVGSLRLV